MIQEHCMRISRRENQDKGTLKIIISLSFCHIIRKFCSVCWPNRWESTCWNRSLPQWHHLDHALEDKKSFESFSMVLGVYFPVDFGFRNSVWVGSVRLWAFRFRLLFSFTYFGAWVWVSCSIFTGLLSTVSGIKFPGQVCCSSFRAPRFSLWPYSRFILFEDIISSVLPFMPTKLVGSIFSHWTFCWHPQRSGSFWLRCCESIRSLPECLPSKITGLIFARTSPKARRICFSKWSVTWPMCRTGDAEPANIEFGAGAELLLGEEVCLQIHFGLLNCRRLFRLKTFSLDQESGSLTIYRSWMEIKLVK